MTLVSICLFSLALIFSIFFYRKYPQKFSRFSLGAVFLASLILISIQYWQTSQIKNYQPRNKGLILGEISQEAGGGDLVVADFQSDNANGTTHQDFPGAKFETLQKLFSKHELLLDAEDNLSGDINLHQGKIKIKTGAINSRVIEDEAIQDEDIDNDINLHVEQVITKDKIEIGGLATFKKGLNIAEGNLDIRGGIGAGANGTEFTVSSAGIVTATGFVGDLTGNADTVTNGLYSTGSYSNPTWLSSISGGVVSGNILGSSSNVTGVVDVSHGGTGLSSFSQGDLLYYSSGTALSKLSKSTTANQFLKNSGTDNAPAWATIADTDISGLGTIATQDADDVSLTGGTLSGTYSNTSNPITLLFGSDTGTTDLVNIQDSDSNTGTGYLLNISTANLSLLRPFFVSASDGTFPAISVNSSGQVGLGTETPYSQLSVVGGATFGATYSLETLADGNVAIETSLGIGTTSPASALEVRSDTETQLTLSYDASNSLTLQVDASGNISFSATGESFTFDQKVVADDFEKTCPTGFVWVPGSAKFGTLPGFCMMKYEAKCDDDADGAGDTTAEDATYKTWHNGTSACTASNSRSVVSSAAGAPIAYISQETARTYCQNLGDGYHLISEAEWMTVAENIANLPINDTDADAGLQLGNGQSDNSPACALSATAEADPTVTGCDLNEDMEDAGNDYVAESCEIQGDGSYGGDDSDKGYYGTSNQWSTSGYVSGASNKSQMRSHVLSNRNVVWDMSGNVLEWVDALITQNEQPTDGTEVGAGSGEWIEWNVAQKLQSSVSMSRPPLDDWTGTNGIGRLYTYGQDETAATMRAFRRGGHWESTSNAGVFALYLRFAPTYTAVSIGFRCAR